jgi:hypothetical protein
MILNRLSDGPATGLGTAGAGEKLKLEGLDCAELLLAKTVLELAG